MAVKGHRIQLRSVNGKIFQMILGASGGTLDVRWRFRNRLTWFRYTVIGCEGEHSIWSLSHILSIAMQGRRKQIKSVRGGRALSQLARRRSRPCLGPGSSTILRDRKYVCGYFCFTKDIIPPLKYLCHKDSLALITLQWYCTLLLSIAKFHLTL